MVKACAAALRDALVWRCVEHVGPGDEDAYVSTLQGAFEHSLDKDTKSQMLNAYHHIIGTLGGVPGAFVSKGSHRSRPRPRRSRPEAVHSSQAVVEADSLPAAAALTSLLFDVSE